MNRIIIIFFAFAMHTSMFGQGVQNNKIDQLHALMNIAPTLDDHCEVPCGIYNDSIRILLMYEHASTIEKGINQINELGSAASTNYNQIVRWVMNKEHHAEEIQEIVSQYFLHQRVKIPSVDASKMDASKYQNQLSSLHEIAVYAMKSKQSADNTTVKKLRDAIHDFEHAYFGDHKH